MNLINNTPLNAEPFFLMDHTGAETLLIVLKGTWSIEKDGKLTVADEQLPIQLSPTYNGDPGSSSLRYDTDIVLEKPGTDCVLIGHAWAPSIGVPHVDVIFAVGPVCQKARVLGERRWIKRGVRAAYISRGAPFEMIPLTWEHAFGGKDTSCKDPAGHEFCLENPVGRGMVSGRSDINIDGLSLPNIEDPADLIQKPGQRPKPRGFGMIAPYWQPRAGYAGTYDENWRENLSPLAPPDLDPRFYSSSAPGLCTPTHLTGTEQVLVEGASPQGALRFDLPAARARASVRCRQDEELVPLQLDTVIVEPDEARVILVWRGIMKGHGKGHEIGMVRVEL
ncbi:MAG: hypothetical protein A2075_00800 [Geobacteraceae bacterium GWC2_58_44]|nr:MAG: hypothetical protein A2075_00800 [Geobacteraceae bacterium GWC2_58_44]HBG06233.1 DUF2169 domain-containing protein [Geobacter sp.]